MRRKWLVALSCVLAISLVSAASASAKPGNGKGPDKANTAAEPSKNETKKESTSESKAQGKPESSPLNSTEEKSKGKSDSPSQSNSKGNSEKNKEQGKDKQQNAKPASVTDDTYKNRGPQGYRGLLHAIENVKDKPAGAVLADLLLTKYEAQLDDETKAKLETIVKADDALSEAADLLDRQGSVTDAVYVQKEAILADWTNLNSYKKLGKLYEKLGKRGLKLYVNGEEPASQVAPVVRNGNTLVPFRVIAESLEAEVTWSAKDQTITVTKDGVTVKLVVGAKNATVNGKKQTLEVPAQVDSGSTLVPARFVSESLGAVVKWEAESQSVVVYEDQDKKE
ncbi:copper amine oxidase N-terminal domain-containing protein [Paenibacillus sp. alder61]|uniref:Copper amine oxidase N-terminal domain-containing protein n=1 Tax=Paenibacillus faecis TaxID=862114 RepID=A0A5D0CZV1_9BACL|nr:MULTISPECIES: copper amine oxidase N-terminal domain-containing protein [Paenibacillus]MCA1293888.1 copper amine oxidase N-terminal domain-containing protein [Paenibacillus sp. alder61]TYA15466.1 copper amine oxidase N-terminal domain-containing protein [Paenibacillus faecis]